MVTGNAANFGEASVTRPGLMLRDSSELVRISSFLSQAPIAVGDFVAPVYVEGINLLCFNPFRTLISIISIDTPLLVTEHGVDEVP